MTTAATEKNLPTTSAPFLPAWGSLTVEFEPRITGFSDDGVPVHSEPMLSVRLDASDKNLPVLAAEIGDDDERRKRAAITRLMLHKPKPGIGEASMPAFIRDVLFDLKEFCALAVEHGCDDTRRLRKYSTFPQSAELIQFCGAWQTALEETKAALLASLERRKAIGCGSGVPEALRPAVLRLLGATALLRWLDACAWAEGPDGGLVLTARSHFIKDWIESRFLDTLAAGLKRPVRLLYPGEAA